MEERTTPLILVVDDDPKIVRLLRSYLEQAGFARRNRRAMARAPCIKSAHLRPDLVVLDFMLPGRDGLAVTRSVRSIPELAHTPILMLTARVDDIDRIFGLEMGADDYVTKPFNPREVVARVKAILRRSRPVGEDSCRERSSCRRPDAGSCSRIVDKAGLPVDLTPSEFDILHLLMAHPGQAFSRTQIIEAGPRLRIRRSGANGRQPHQESAPQSGGGSQRASLDRDGLWRGVPVERLRRRRVIHEDPRA